MNFIAQVRERRQKLAAVLADDEYSGIREIVEELYPDRAHFLYELLQNAEDTGAAEAHFELHADRLVFTHTGRPFTEKDVEGITNIGKGTKRDQEDKIGRFGVGFKAVFAYSETPHVWSPTFSFKITDLVLPTELPPLNLGNRTRFEFPFNNPKKPAAAAFAEVRDGLTGLSETALLFLPHLALVDWRIAGEPAGEIRRRRYSDAHVEVIKTTKGQAATSRAHFLKFDEPVRGLEKQRVAVAYALEFLPDVEIFAANRPLAEQLKVVPAAPGRVAVFFPAEKETSGLRFHLHAPFVPELSRASVKETPANDPLFDQLAALAAASLHRVRDLKLLTADFLEVLPNARDELGERYDAIRAAIIGAMNDQPLTPTHAKSHAPARTLVQGRAALKSLLGDEDLEFLIDCEDEAPRWAAAAAQRNSNADRMLESLDLTRWDVEDFVAVLADKTAAGRPGRSANVTPEELMTWLGEKPAAWHQELYALLFAEYLAPAGYRREERAAALGRMRIVRLAGGGHGVAAESFFGADAAGHDPLMRCVDPETYTTGRAKVEKENARALLTEIGVREVGAGEVVEMILKRRYTREAAVPDEETYLKDLARFVELVEAEPDRAPLFGEYFIFQCGSWSTPEGVYIDSPYRATGLSAYYAPFGEDADRHPLDERYLRCGIGTTRLVDFAIATGAAAALAIQPTTCRANPDAARLVLSAPGNWSKRYGLDADYCIPGLDGLLAAPSLALSRLIWNTLSEQEDDSWAVARYRNNSDHTPREAPSQLACLLSERAWVPQAGGFVRPREANRDQLPAGFPFDPGWGWLNAIGFGQTPADRPDEDVRRAALARELGFDDGDALERVRRFAALPAEQQQEILEQFARPPIDLPERTPADAGRRAERVSRQAADAPERRTEERMRSVSVNRDAVKKDAGEYLRQQYTTADGEMICQACRDRLPFKLDDGSDYFERVELVRGLKRHHKQNYAALCPTHAAMFLHANGSADDLGNLIRGAAGREVIVVLAREDVPLHFTEAHLVDLKAVLAADASEPCQSEADAVASAAVAAGV